MSSDGLDFGVVVPPPADPPVTLWPTRNRVECVVDTWGVFLADPANNMIGFDTNWGNGGPLPEMLMAERVGTRAL